MTPLPNISLLLSDARGQYIPRDFVTDFDLTLWEGIDPNDAEICTAPEHEWYWEAWNNILRDATYTDPDGRVFTLYQDGDLWALCLEEMTEEEKKNFGFSEE